MTTTDALNKVASDEGFRDFTTLMQNSSLAYIADRCQRAMKLYAKDKLAEVLEDGCGNINTVQSIDDAIKTYKSIELK